MKHSNIIVIERREGLKPGQGLLHTMDACPERLMLAKGSFDICEPTENELAVLRTKHVTCPTCTELEVASSADRVRFLLASLATKKAG
jgi:hypothetical protein